MRLQSVQIFPQKIGYKGTDKISIKKKITKNLDFKFLLLNIRTHKVQNLIEMLSRKVEGLDPMKP